MQNLNLSTQNIVILVLIALLGFFVVTRCKLSCGGTREGLSHRLTTTKLLKDVAYERSYKTPYTQKWDYDLSTPTKENYTDAYRCDKMCENVLGATPYADCMQECRDTSLGTTAMQRLVKPCTSLEDCGYGQTCISPAPYTGGTVGYCMSDNEPGIPRMTIPSFRENLQKPERENFVSPVTCFPNYFFNEAAGRCEPRFQGSSSAIAVRSGKPGPTPIVSLPGTIFPGYGVGYNDPLNKPVYMGDRGPELQPLHLVTDQ